MAEMSRVCVEKTGINKNDRNRDQRKNSLERENCVIRNVEAVWNLNYNREEQQRTEIYA